MKRIIPVMVIFLSISATLLIAQEQVIELNFKAFSKGTTVIMDSIFIENLSQGADTSLFVYDSVLQFAIISSVNNYQNPAHAMAISIYPNPVVQTATITFSFPVNQSAKLLVINPLGQQVAIYKGNFRAGSYRFLFSPASESYYFIVIRGERNSGYGKLINLNRNSSRCKLEAISEFQNPEKQSFISTLADFPFSPGDKIRFSCYAKTKEGYSGSDYIEDSLVSSENYSFSINPGIPCRGMPYIHYSGKTYHTLQYGPQCWLKENLNFAYLGSWCYENNILNCDEYGRLYDWASAMEACPPGWHLPSDVEWYELVNYISGPSGAAGKMKETDTTHWLPPNYTSNSSGFSALPGGYFYNSPGAEPYFNAKRKDGYFWTSTEDDSENKWAWRWFMDYASEAVNHNRDDKRNAISVRCMRSVQSRK